jgi:hypothetical protein
MSEVTHQQADLLLKLYEMRREPRLRQARAWFTENFNAGSMPELMALCPTGSDNNAFMRQVLSYWEMCASFVNRGLIDEDFFFENTGEQWLVFERIKPVLGEVRTTFRSPQFLENLERHVKRLEEWRERKAPGSLAATREWMKQQAAARAAKAASSTGS